ncbi:D-alanyl-D-alanine carboxypeptidase [Bacillus aquiflavi]|uniref:D-alanyl-D-alanine carboxypeptidase n=1 Tax=Bacillus aquiflavi TaxID=2672567 RepID=A0A6B3W1N5_9BACI|nr:D-alanyl-D-alanine carboxypeptidase family protein [Bacillus aquiflavi]MBA4537196.1 D-alanyl-D-alanine carboxypeptidase [Bacillus aquiflavi]NEY81454.1 D-alanyl-D-alanine carboxypeptidase [Bacillus aquiflavi]
MRILKTLMITFILMIILIFLGAFFLSKPTISAESGVLMDADTGEIIFEKKGDVPSSPASMSKIMSEYIVLEKIHNGSISWNDVIVINDRTVDSNGVKINVNIGDRLTVRDLFSAMVIASANNAAVALAEYISGSEENFTELMNKKAREMGLSDKTYFVNATGLPNSQLANKESQMTAIDVAKLSYQLINDFPEVLETTRLDQYEMDYAGVILYNTNAMLFDPKLNFDGIDGLKTGFTDLAGYCFAGTAKQGEKRLISVVMGAEEEEQRFVETRKLLSYGFDRSYFNFEYIINKFLK